MKAAVPFAVAGIGSATEIFDNEIHKINRDRIGAFFIISPFFSVREKLSAERSFDFEIFIKNRNKLRKCQFFFLINVCVNHHTRVGDIAEKTEKQDRIVIAPSAADCILCFFKTAWKSGGQQGKGIDDG